MPAPPKIPPHDPVPRRAGPEIHRAAPSRRRPALGLRHTDRTRPQVRLPLTGVVPAHPTTADHLLEVPAWNGNTNFHYGTCMICAEANSAIMTWHYLANTAVTVSDEEIFRLYRLSGNPSFDPGTGRGDDGCDPTVALAALVREGINLTMPDGSVELHKPLCYGEVALPPYDNMHAATAVFGGAVGAFDLDEAQDGQTSRGLWDYLAGSQPWGGHAVWCGAYTSASGEHELDEALITWERRCGTTPGFVAHQLYGLYAIVWEPLWNAPGFIDGVDRAALAASFEAVTGRAFPVPLPPAPAPPAPLPPGPSPLTDYLADARLARWATARHLGDNAYAARAYQRLKNTADGIWMETEPG